MKVVLLSNFLNPHTVNLCIEFLLHKKVKEFYFIATVQQSKERELLGFKELNHQYDFVLRMYNENEKKIAIELIKNADVVISGGLGNEFVTQRIKDNKLTFIYSERIYKFGLYRCMNPISRKNIYEKLLKYKNNNVYYLSVGAYMPYDLSLLGFPKEKIFQWAYFPEVKCLKIEKSAQLTLLWVGRMIKEKHPQIAVEIAEKLKLLGIEFRLVMIGDGPEAKKIQDSVREKGLETQVEFLGICPPDVTQSYMAESKVFLFTSDYWEGWGATLSESMGHGCVPIASYKAGASEILIENDINGYIYHTIDEAIAAIKNLLQDEVKMIHLSDVAKYTIETKWSAKNAVYNFIKVAESLLNGQDYLQINETEPMAKATIRKAKNYFSSDF